MDNKNEMLVTYNEYLCNALAFADEPKNNPKMPNKGKLKFIINRFGIKML